MTSEDNQEKLIYNSNREDLIIPEYGRHIQKMVKHCVTIEDREKRNAVAHDLIAIMGQLFPHLRDVEDYKHKLWDHLYVMSDFKLDVDGPYPKPSAEQFQEKPEKVDYPVKDIKYGHYGAFIPKFIDLACSLENEEEKEAFTVDIINLMKRSYLQWNRDSVKDEVLIEHLTEMSNGQLKLTNPNKIKSVNELNSTKSRKKNSNRNNSNRNNNNRNKKRY